MADNPYSSTEKKNGMQWWKSEKACMHDDIFSFIHHLDTDQSYRQHQNLRFMKLYGNHEMIGLDSYSYSRVETSHSVKHRVTLNVIQSMIDTVVAKMTKNKPKPTFLTDGGDWSLQRKAKKLTKFCEGVFNSTDFYQEAVKAFRDSCIFGTGAIKIYKEHGEIKAERVFIDEIKIDDSEAFYTKPRQAHQVKYVHKDVLLQMFPEAEFQINQALHSPETHGTARGTQAENLLKVVESWHLPSGPVKDKKGNPMNHDGLHTITIQNKVLFSEPYSRKDFPFVFFRWNERPVGFYGTGIAEMLQGIQLEINKILRTIQISMHLCSIPKVFVEASSKVVTAHLNNKVGGIIKYVGTPPKYEALSAVPGELFSHLDKLYERSFEIAGVSMLSAQSRKPGGLDSGKALREFNDIESERFMEVGQRFERAFVQAAEQIVCIAKELYEEDKDFKVKVKGKKFIETIKWADVDMDEDKFLMDVFPTSSLSNTPAGRLQDVQELLTAGFISKEDGLKLLDFPDLENTMSLLNAGLDDIERMIEKMVDEGEYETPEPYQNLELGIRKCQQAYLKYKSEGADDETLELLRRWMEDAQALLLKAAQGSNPPPPLTGSQVLPNQNGSVIGPTNEQLIAQAGDQVAAAAADQLAAQESVPTAELPGQDIPGDQEPLAPNA